MTEKTWLGAYLYYTEPWETFITEAIAPFVARALQNKEVDRYFFIRYWERGPHIRLRFFGEQGFLDEVLKPVLEEHFASYFSEKPSRRIEPEWVQQLSAEQQWLPNNSIQWIPYEPEVERYGGPQAILIGEEQFQASSNAVIEIMNEGVGWSYERALGAGIQMHLAFTYALGMDLMETQEFFSYIFSGWTPMAYAYAIEPKNVEGMKAAAAATIKAFNDQFNQQKASLTAYHQMLWDGLGEDAEFEQDWLNSWRYDMQEIGKKLRSLHTEGLVSFPSERMPADAFTPYRTEVKKQHFWSVYGSYVHMTNNRLGILNRDEGYLGFLIMKSLELVDNKRGINT